MRRRRAPKSVEPPEPEPERSLPVPAARALERGVDAFNSSAYRRTVASIAKGLGVPRASVVVLSGSRPDAIVTVAWEISWYQYRVEAERGGHVRLDTPWRRPRRDRPALRDWKPRSRPTASSRSSRRIDSTHATDRARVRPRSAAHRHRRRVLAINRYEQQTFTLTDEEARETVARILDERKQHVALLLAQLRRLDPKQREKLDR